MRGRCYVETVDGNIVRIFRSQGSAMNSKAWDEKRVVEYPRRDATLAIRKQIYERSKNKCEFCNNFITWNFHMHERVPKGKGGETSLENSVAICAPCHLFGENSAHSDRQVRFGENDMY